MVLSVVFVVGVVGGGGGGSVVLSVSLSVLLF